MRDESLKLAGLELRVTPLDARAVVELVASDRRPNLLLNHNLHSAYLYYKDREFRKLYDRASCVLIDGFPIWILARMRRPWGVRSGTRIGSTDWIELLLIRDPSMSVVAVGGSRSTASRMAQMANEQCANLKWDGYDGFEFRPVASDQQELDAALAAADLVLVGMGMPLQERWIASRMGSAPHGQTLANIGGALDYFVGAQSLSPRWMGRIGLEWLYRLVHSPKRLGHRYLVEPFLLLGLVVRGRCDRFGKKQGMNAPTL